ncbi:tRNA preQ1(34) S-adenosylmethionine ribosyltransferase-isomerase QueA [Moraxella nasovis]|uniref:tRNA preQ1(34) S-adenosylmethionine ribosyltransferase-isomerase QueA n=1 Tax=Moraxella nasovis TaxID=2904121 RepID=UPI001F622EFC|nr:tRNA preQ1(34) S-adenosylmethionine ribosyltransferase-isomerase QueA [Moraxella nasovis]UNU73108.1 tRNA preQ1(34) S-adenosylmethionine ribosyltransferase-isomerase QueA [Moraxella nasovis]
MNKPLLTTDFDYHLPDELIARYPLAVRSSSRLLHVKGENLTDLQFSDLPNLLNKGDLLVLNDTKVMKARLFGVKDTGGAVEVLIERITDHEKHIAHCHVRSSRALKVGQKVHLADGQMTATMCGRSENLFILQFDKPILNDLDKYGQMPIPPYFERTADDTDDTCYQTVFHDPAKQASVAAPTASLHFDDDTLQALTDKGVQIAFVTLHVGAGTFAPVKTDDLTDHIMHAEYAHLPQATADKINATKANGGQVIAVGTTVTRVLETAHLHRKDGRLSEFMGDTQIFIYPPYDFGVVDRLITNFHLPKSTLLMLVSAFAGVDNIKQAYAHAISQEYRFFSYGDAMLLDKHN